MQNTKKSIKREPRDVGQHQTDLAEGELDTVEESIAIHEKKHDVQGQPPAKEKESKGGH